MSLRSSYQSICAIIERQGQQGVPELVQYLQSLHTLGSHLDPSQPIPASQFLLMLELAFRAVESADKKHSPSSRTPDPEFNLWQATISAQISDLAAMMHVRSSESELRCFGIDAPSGARWCNFDPCTFLECAAAGIAENSGQKLFRDPATGELRIRDRASHPQQTSPEWTQAEESVRWIDFATFLVYGQIYE